MLAKADSTLKDIHELWVYTVIYGITNSMRAYWHIKPIGWNLDALKMKMKSSGLT